MRHKKTKILSYLFLTYSHQIFVKKYRDVNISFYYEIVSLIVWYRFQMNVVNQANESNQYQNELVVKHVFRMDNRRDIRFDQCFVDIANIVLIMVLYLMIDEESQ